MYKVNLFFFKHYYYNYFKLVHFLLLLVIITKRKFVWYLIIHKYIFFNVSYRSNSTLRNTNRNRHIKTIKKRAHAVRIGFVCHTKTSKYQSHLYDCVWRVLRRNSLAMRERKRRCDIISSTVNIKWIGTFTCTHILDIASGFPPAPTKTG